MTNIIWGDYPGGSLGKLPAQRMGYNAASKKGLSNLSKDKINLVNVSWYYGESLCTDKALWQAVIKTVCEKSKGYHIIILPENEPGNKNVITNTTPLRYKNVLLWTKEVADAYGVQVMHGGIMMPAAAAILAGTMDKGSAMYFRDRMSAGGFNVGSPSKAQEAIDQLLFCNAYGILGNFHWQQEYIYLSQVIDCLKGYCEDISNNELAVRDGKKETVLGIAEAVEGSLSYGIWFNQDLGKQAKVFTTEQSEAFMKYIGVN